MRKIGKQGMLTIIAAICLLVLGGVPVRAQGPHSRHQGGADLRSSAPIQEPVHQPMAPRHITPKPQEPPEPVIIYRGQNPAPAPVPPPAPAPAPQKKGLLSILLPHLSIDLDL